MHQCIALLLCVSLTVACGPHPSGTADHGGALDSDTQPHTPDLDIDQPDEVGPEGNDTGFDPDLGDWLRIDSGDLASDVDLGYRETVEDGSDTWQGSDAADDPAGSDAVDSGGYVLFVVPDEGRLVVQPCVNSGGLFLLTRTNYDGGIEPDTPGNALFPPQRESMRRLSPSGVQVWESEVSLYPEAAEHSDSIFDPFPLAAWGSGVVLLHNEAAAVEAPYSVAMHVDRFADDDGTRESYVEPGTLAYGPGALTSAGDFIVVTSQGVLALSVSNSVLWRTKLTDEPLTPGYRNAAVVANDGTVFVSLPDDSVAALSTEGSVLFTNKPDGDWEEPGFPNGVALKRTPLLADGHLVLAGGYPGIIAFDRVGLAVDWKLMPSSCTDFTGQIVLSSVGDVWCRVGGTVGVHGYNSPVVTAVELPPAANAKQVAGVDGGMLVTSTAAVESSAGVYVDPVTPTANWLLEYVGASAGFWPLRLPDGRFGHVSNRVITAYDEIPAPSEEYWSTPHASSRNDRREAW